MTACRCLAAWIFLLWAWAVPGNAMDLAPATSSADRLWRLAAQEQASLEQRGALLQSDSLMSYLQTVAGRLWEQAHGNLDPPTVRVIADTRMEAYAYPNGHLYLTTGILHLIENEDQLAMIIAHEMVHYVRQHAVELYAHFQNDAPEAGLPYTRRPLAAGGDAMAKKIDAAESQADREGLSIFKNAGYCPAEVLILMSNLMGSLQNQGPPETIERLRKRIRWMRTILDQAPQPSFCSPVDAGGRENYLKRISPALIANAQTALQHGDWDLADQSVSKFLVLKPDDARAYYIKGEILRRRHGGDSPKQCVGFYEQALSIDPGFTSAHRALGELYFKAGRYQTAKSHFEAFISLAPHDEAIDFVKGYLRQCQN